MVTMAVTYHFLRRGTGGPNVLPLHNNVISDIHKVYCIVKGQTVVGMFSVVVVVVVEVCCPFILGGWELAGVAESGNWSINSEDFLQEKLLGSSALFDFGPTIDYRDSNNIILWVSFFLWAMFMCFTLPVPLQNKNRGLRTACMWGELQ